MVLCEEEMELQRAKKPDSSMKGKKYAGVCANFALVACALLREAGISSGLLTGFDSKSKTMRISDSHATAFVTWPDGKGGIRLLSIDGTPRNQAAIAAGVVRPSLRETEVEAKEERQKEVAVAKEVVESLVKAAGANDVATIEGLTNSKLEDALNVILQYEVKQSHLHALKRVLDAYWYGLYQMERDMSDVRIRKALEEELVLEHTRVQPTEAETIPAGTELLEAVRSFVTRAQRGKQATDLEGAFAILERIADLSKRELSDVEHRALVATTQYLKAKKMSH